MQSRFQALGDWYKFVRDYLMDHTIPLVVALQKSRSDVAPHDYIHTVDYATLEERYAAFAASRLGKLLGSDTIFALEEFSERMKCKLRLCDDCSRCGTFVCGSCGRKVPWEYGASDSMFDVCDDCWAEAHRK